MTVVLTQLENGLRIVTDTVHDVESTAIGVYCGVGTRHESQSENGIAHLLEHMLFKGTERRSALQIAEAIEDVGGTMNAFTGREMTGYYTHIIRGDERLSVDLLSDMLQHSVFDKDELLRERAVIFQEIANSIDTPDDIVFDYYQELAYPDQTLGAPTLGRPEVLESVDSARLQEYLTTHYVGGNMVVSAAGPINHDDFVGLVKTYFTHIPSGTARDAQPASYKGGSRLINKDLEQSQVVLGFESVHRTHPLYHATHALSLILGGNMSSRLFQEVREKRGLAYTISTHFSPYTDTGQFIIHAGTAGDNIHELLQVVKDQLQTLPDTLEEKELQRAKIQMKASLLMARESMMTRAEQQARSLLFKGEIFKPETSLEKIAGINKKHIEMAMRTILDKPRTIVIYGKSGTIDSGYLSKF